MSSSCVLMRIILCRHFLLFISVFSELSDHAVSEPYIENNGIKFSGDFMNFLKDMGRIVYNHNVEKYVTEVPRRPTLRLRSTTTRSYQARLDSRSDVNVVTPEKTALRDVLMMKLVSYYEDKYKLSDPATTLRVTTNNEFIKSGGKKRYGPIKTVDDIIGVTPVEHNDVADVVVI